MHALRIIWKRTRILVLVLALVARPTFVVSSPSIIVASASAVEILRRRRRLPAISWGTRIGKSQTLTSQLARRNSAGRQAVDTLEAPSVTKQPT